MKKIALIVAAMALTPALAMADTTVDAKISTLGLGAEVAIPVMEKVDARIGINTYNYNFSKTTTSATATTSYSGKLNLQSLQALADWHPWAGSFRVSGGLMYNNNSFSMTALPGAGNTITVNNAPYALKATDSVNSNISFNKIAPYLGIGWGRTPKNTGLSFTSDFGILFQGSPRATVTTNVPGVDLAKTNSDLNSSLNSFKMYPVLSVGIGYTF
jgi:hypothetical protein